MSMNERRQVRQQRRRQNQRAVANTSLFLLGLLVGLAGGLYYAWVVQPRARNTAGIEVLRPIYKEEYLFMVSQSYAANGDWEQAATRLARLQDPLIDETVVALLEQYLRAGRPAEQVRNLARLAEELGADSPVLALFAPTPAPVTAVTPEADPNDPNPTATATLLPTPTPSLTPSPTASPTVSPTPLPSATPTAVPDYRLLQQESVCYADDTPPKLEIVVVDANRVPLPGAEIIVSWGEGNSDRFFTGFKPAQGLGYADLLLIEGVSYTVSIVGGSEPVGGLQVSPCPGENGLLGWQLRFQNLAVDQEAEAEAAATAEAEATPSPTPTIDRTPVITLSPTAVPTEAPEG